MLEFRDLEERRQSVSLGILNGILNGIFMMNGTFMEYLLGFMVDFLPSHVWFWGFHGWFNSFALREHVFSQISHHLILGWCLDAETHIKFEAFTGFMWKQMGLFLVFPDWFGVLENRSETLLQFAFRCLWTAERPGSLFLFFSVC